MARPVITNIRRGDPDGNAWDLNTLANDAFFALNDGSSAFDEAVAKLNLESTDLTVADLDAYAEHLHLAVLVRELAVAGDGEVLARSGNRLQDAAERILKGNYSPAG